MSSLSISAAWDEAKAILARDGRLYMSVALAMIALPTAINALVNPRGMGDRSAPLWADCVGIVASLIALAGQLALIRLALGPSVTVGGAIAHGFRRLPGYFLAILIILFGFLVAAIPLVMVMVASGVPIQDKPPASPVLILAAILVAGLVIFIGVRFMLAATVASAERASPIAILKRSWRLTAGNFWPLVGFLIVYLIGAIILMFAVGSVAGALIGLTLGSIQPMSAGALLVALLQALVSAVVSTLFFVMIARIYLQLAGRGDVQAGVPSSGT